MVVLGYVGKATGPHWAFLPLVPPSFKRASGGPQEAILVRAGDKAILSCETDSLPEPAVAWFKDQQPLALGQRIQGLQGGQKLEILDSQVSGRGQSERGHSTSDPRGLGKEVGGGDKMWGGVISLTQVDAQPPASDLGKAWTPVPAQVCLTVTLNRALPYRCRSGSQVFVE